MDYSYFNSGPGPQAYQYFNLPPTPALSTPQQDLSTEHYDSAFAAFQTSFPYGADAYQLAQPSHAASVSPAVSQRNESVISIPEVNINNIQPGPNDLTPEELGRTRSSSEEKDTLTPAQSRRKAQNRAAQRAFRERKDRHVKDLEAKLNSLEHHSASLNGENERLKRALAKVATENEILKATSGAGSSNQDEMDDLIHGPLRYNPTEYRRTTSAESMLGGLEVNGMAKSGIYNPVYRTLVDEHSGEPLLTSGATWDYIQRHELFQKGLVDVGDVCERLKKMARCDGQGPVFLEGDIRQAIAESSVAGGRDELI